MGWCGGGGGGHTVGGQEVEVCAVLLPCGGRSYAELKHAIALAKALCPYSC
jgi:hypothetical protein